MPKRALFVFDWRRLTEEHLRFVEDKAVNYDELIFLLDREDELQPALRPDQDDTLLDPVLAGEGRRSCGEVIAMLNRLLLQRLPTKPYHLLPVTGRGQPDLYHWLRWKILCPAFEKVYIDEEERGERWGTGRMMQSVLQVPVEIVTILRDSEKLVAVRKDRPVSRGLFITRAQPWHLGHAAFIGQMKKEVEEVIVLLAMANKSHLPTDIATAGERMEMVRPWLEENLPGRYYLIPLAYSDFTLENIYELQYLLPSFQQVFTSNPTIEAMATTAGYAVRSLRQSLAVSGTMVRDCMLTDRSYREHLPPTTYHYLQHSGIPERLKKIHARENRL